MTRHRGLAAWVLYPVLLACVEPVALNAQSGRDLVVEPAAPLRVPDGAEPFRMSGTITNGQPVSATSTQFSPDFCERVGAFYGREDLGEMRTQLASEGRFAGTLSGEAALLAEACMFGPPSTLVAFLTLTTADGDVLNLSVRLVPTPDSPPAPDREATGRGTVVGGTGRFEGASGRVNVNAKSHGDVIAGTNVATERDIDINGYIRLQPDNRQ